jgi:hypothetical protein
MARTKTTVTEGEDIDQQEEDFEAKLIKLRILKQEKVNGVRVKVDDADVVVSKKTVRYTNDFVEHYEDFKTIASVKEDMKDNDAHKTEVVWECSCYGKKFNFVFHQDHDNDVEFEGDVSEDIDQQELEEVLTEKLVHPIMYEEEEPKAKKAKKEKAHDFFESKHDYIPGFLEALGELADLYEKDDDFRATSFRRAIIALEGQIITSVEDIKLFKLIELKGVGKSTLKMLEEFINDGKIEKLEEKKQPKLGCVSKEEWDAFIKAHPPLRQYEHEQEFIVGLFPEDEVEKLKYGEYIVYVNCVYHERTVKDELINIIEKTPTEYSDEERLALVHGQGTPTYDIAKLIRSIKKYEFSLGCVHEEYIFEGYLVEEGTNIKTHPFKIAFSGESHAYKEAEVLTTLFGWTPPGFTEYLLEELNLNGGWEDKIREYERGYSSPVE